MKACGVIVEYNPFHNGHRYHLQQAREQTGADVVVAVMSGNFLQRGEPAIVDKWTRAEMALLQGADLVIELPFAYAVQSADYFAVGAVKLLQALQVESLVFGTDVKETVDYQGFGAFVANHQAEIDTRYQAMRNNGQSYPQQMTALFRELLGLPLDFSSPNHILGLSYAKENAKYSQPMTLIPIHREQAGYHDEMIKGTIASATAIRKGLEAGTDVALTMPKTSWGLLQTQPLISWQNFWPLLRYQLLVQTPSDLRRIYQMTEGIEYRLQAAAEKAETFAAFIEAVKTKRYTWTRLQRLCCYILGQVTENEIQGTWQNTFLHVLGFTSKGQQFLKERKKTADLPILTRIGRDTPHFSLDEKISHLYQLGSPEISEQVYGRFPLQR